MKLFQALAKEIFDPDYNDWLERCSRDAVEEFTAAHPEATPLDIYNF